MSYGALEHLLVVIDEFYMYYMFYTIHKRINLTTVHVLTMNYIALCSVQSYT